METLRITPPTHVKTCLFSSTPEKAAHNRAVYAWLKVIGAALDARSERRSRR